MGYTLTYSATDVQGFEATLDTFKLSGGGALLGMSFYFPASSFPKPSGVSISKGPGKGLFATATITRTVSARRAWHWLRRLF